MSDLRTDVEKFVLSFESWEYDDGLTMNRKVYHHGKLRAVIPIEIIQDTPQMRPFRVAHSFGNREHRPTDTDVMRSVDRAVVRTTDVFERTLTDEKIAELWHKNGGFHHHFARAVERWLKGEE
jgi:hypothetical protein